MRQIDRLRCLTHNPITYLQSFLLRALQRDDLGRYLLKNHLYVLTFLLYCWLMPMVCQLFAKGPELYLRLPRDSSARRERAYGYDGIVRRAQPRFVDIAVGTRAARDGQHASRDGVSARPGAKPRCVGRVDDRDAGAMARALAAATVL